MPRHSAVLPAYTKIGIHAHHRDMAKFGSVDDPGYQEVTGEIRRWVENHRSRTPDGQHPPSTRPLSTPYPPSSVLAHGKRWTPRSILSGSVAGSSIGIIKSNDGGLHLGVTQGRQPRSPDRRDPSSTSRAPPSQPTPPAPSQGAPSSYGSIMRGTVTDRSIGIIESNSGGIYL